MAYLQACARARDRTNAKSKARAAETFFWWPGKEYYGNYDVIIIGHACTRARALEQGYWHAIAADECLTRQREKNGGDF